jgi:hypothetical protein
MGTHKAVTTVRRAFARGGQAGQRLYYPKLDVESFFRSINKDVLYQMVKKKLANSFPLTGGGVL